MYTPHTFQRSTLSAGFTTKRVNHEAYSDMSDVNERREKSPQAGFTMVETLVAISVLALAVAGPLMAASRALVVTEIARDQLTATYLAQEAIEYVRAMRDNEYLAIYPSGTSATAWNNFINGNDVAAITQCKSPSTCTLDPTRPMGTGTNSALTVCSGNSCGPLYLVNGVYTQQSGLGGAVKTAFTRVLTASQINGNEENITATVTWSFHGTTYTVTVTDHLTSWQ